MFKLNKYRKELAVYLNYINKHYDEIDLLDDKISELCFFMKDIAPKFSKKDIIQDEYRLLARKFNRIERSLPSHFILENNPICELEREYKKSKILNYSEEEIINYIVYRARKILASLASEELDCDDVYLGEVDLVGYCNKACMAINLICQSMKIPCKVMTISPAFYEKRNIYEIGGNHQYCLITLGDKRYVVDVTYSQFFLMKENNLNRIGIPLMGGCNVGVYMTLIKERCEFAKKLMQKGWFLETDENLKLYFDGFAISYRNGLYYENIQNIDYTTNYSASDYLNFMNQVDSQVNHEKLEFLGRQKRLLKDKYLDFNVKR